VPAKCFYTMSNRTTNSIFTNSINSESLSRSLSSTSNISTSTTSTSGSSPEKKDGAEARVRKQPRAAGSSDMGGGDLELSSVGASSTTRRNSKETFGEKAIVFLRTPCVAVLVGLIEYVPTVMLAWSISKKFEFYDYVLQYTGNVFAAAAVLGALGAVLAGLSSLLVQVVEPNAAGSGLPELISYLNDKPINPSFFTLKTSFTKLVGIILAVSSGLAIGREGPAVHIGAGLAYATLTRFGVDGRHAASIGAVGGFAAAFRVPMAAIMYVFEEIASTRWSLSTGYASSIAAATATLVIGGLFNLSEGSLSVNFNSVVIFDPKDSFGSLLWTYADVPSFLLAAIGAGVQAGVLGRIGVFLTRYRRRAEWRQSTVAKVLEAALLALLTALIFALLPAVVDGCEGVPEDDHYDDDHRRLSGRQLGGAAPRRYVSWTCEDETFSPLASLTLVGEEGAIRHLLARDGTLNFTPASLVIFLLAYFTACSLAMGLSLPAGTFVPNLLAGCCWGRLIGEVAVRTSLRDYCSNPGVVAAIGAGAQLGAWTRTSMAITCLIAEVTGDLSLVVPTLLSIALAREVAALIQHEAFTHDVLEVLGLPFSRQHSLHRDPWGGHGPSHQPPDSSLKSPVEEEGGSSGAIAVLEAEGAAASV